jgi:SulP family sulfate permease
MQLPILRWAGEWRQPGAVRADLLAGLTGAVVVLPQGVAFATLAGLPPQYGLYSAMVPCIVAALFGSSRLMVTGPANAISLTTMALVAPLAAIGSPRYVELVLTLTLLVGVMQLLLGWARVGSWIERMPHSVVVGFTAGAAVLIVNSQIGPLLGLALPRGAPVADNVAAAVAGLAGMHPLALLAGLATIGMAIAARPLNRLVPAMLVAVVGGAAVTHAARWLWPAAPQLAMVQALPGALPPLSMPDLSIDTVRSLFAATLVMTLLALTEATAIARSVARARGDKLDGNQEFVGQGLANVAGAFFSAYPSSGSFNRSGVNLASGARTPLSAVAAALWLMLILSLVGSWATLLPLAVISGLLMVVAWGLLDRREITRIWREEPHERLPLAVTAIATVSLSLEWAILLGVISALGMHAWRTRRRRGGDAG